MRRVLPMVAVVLLVLGATGSAAAAKVLRTEISGTQQAIDLDLSEARVWQAGPIEQVRGLQVTIVQQDSQYGQSLAHVDANQRLDTRTGIGRGWGTWRSDFGGGGFEGTYQGTIEDGWGTWQVVGHGWGDLAGQQVRATLTEDLTIGQASYTGTLQVPPRR